MDRHHATARKRSGRIRSSACCTIPMTTDNQLVVSRGGREIAAIERGPRIHRREDKGCEESQVGKGSGERWRYEEMRERRDAGIRSENKGYIGDTKRAGVRLAEKIRSATPIRVPPPSISRQKEPSK